jgi:hypothetical protein
MLVKASKFTNVYAHLFAFAWICFAAGACDAVDGGMGGGE